MSWKTVLLKDHVDMISGYPFKSERFTGNKDDIPLVKCENIGQGRILWNESKYWNKDELDSLSKFVLQEDDVILAMDRPWVSAGLKYASITSTDPIALLVQRAARLRGLNGLKTKFLKYIIASREFSEYMKNIMGGTNVPHVSGSQIGAFQFKLPSEEEQHRIADILSTYDDLIENNRRRIDLLEQSARMLYKEWFVSLRFPGHEHVKVKDGVPQGWERLTAFDVMEIMSGGTPKTQEPSYWDGDIPFYTPKDYSDAPYALSTERSITEIGLANCNSRLYPKNTIFISARGTVGKIIMAQKPMAMSQTSYALCGKNGISPFFLYSALQANLQQFLMRATGAVFSAIVVDTFKNIPFILPSQSLIDNYEENATPIFAQIETLLLANERLQQARDLLLPRLMNGEIPV